MPYITTSLLPINQSFTEVPNFLLSLYVLFVLSWDSYLIRVPQLHSCNWSIYGGADNFSEFFLHRIFIRIKIFDLSQSFCWFYYSPIFLLILLFLTDSYSCLQKLFLIPSKPDLCLNPIILFEVCQLPKCSLQVQNCVPPNVLYLELFAEWCNGNKSYNIFNRLKIKRTLGL